MGHRFRAYAVHLAFPSVRFVLIMLPTLAGQARAGVPIDYDTQVKPVLKQRCYSCHGALKQKAGLRLDTGSSVLRGGQSGPAVEPGNAGESLLIDHVTATEPALRMPPEGSPLTAEQIANLRGWVDQGAAFPADEQPETDPRRHWAFLKPVRPVVPANRNRGWARNPIDAFLARKHEDNGIAPLPSAEPHVLLRRVYLDLTGLPPTREELHAFLSDPSDAAYERVVDRLLDSPRYGERWARHWMDVWRYSDWYGRRAVPDVTNSYAQIWRWRDWIVRSLNEDKGYDRMVQEMLAADELAPNDASNIVATGFLVRNFYRWNYNLWMKDNVEHTGKALLGLTFNCAHCHDHKYDPIKHEDYFAFRAFFEPLEIRHDRVPGEPDPGPYPKYTYGAAYKPITSGLVRVFDEKLDAQTLFYTRGESRNVVAGKPPIPPGMPGFLGGGSLKIEPVSLPVQASYPGLKEFIEREELGPREAAVVEAEGSLAASRERAMAAELVLAEATEHRASVIGPAAFDVSASEVTASAEARAAAAAGWSLRIDSATQVRAKADLAAVQARIVADRARAGLCGGDVTNLSRVAVRAERQAAVDQAAVELIQAERAVWEARTKTKAEAAKADLAKTAARKRLETARVALSGPDAMEYTRLSPVYPSRSTGRRTALARWITDRANPLAARVAINHIWGWHFGTPLVATTSDFGRNGKAPTHPELLDWLAVELMEPSTTAAAPWSQKAIHRLIVTSAAYRLSSHPGAPARHEQAVDPDNRWHWRFQSGRMEAEEVRDGLLQVAGSLDPRIGGPDIDFSQGLVSHRRSLYFTHHGEARMPFLALFDAADACDCYRRTTSVVPQQALALVNNDFLVTLSRRLADQLWTGVCHASGDRDQAFVEAAFEQVLSRPPSASECDLSRAFLARQARVFEAAKRAGTMAVEPAPRARGGLVHALFSHNDFITIH